jgi:hypothetical protein
VKVIGHVYEENSDLKESLETMKKDMEHMGET